MADIQYYERVLKLEKASSKLTSMLIMIGIYVLLLSIWFVIIVRVGASASLIMLIPISIFTVVLLTWKYTSVEYEYSFAAGHFTFSKVYGRSKRKAIFDTDLDCLVGFAAYNEKNMDNLNVNKTINAIPEKLSVPNPVICTFEENGRSTAVILDCDELTLKILKFFKGSAYVSFSI